MPMYSASAQGAAGSATLPFGALRSGTSTNSPIIREIKCFTTAANAARIRIVRITTAGTSTAITRNELDEAKTPPIATAAHTYTSTGPTIQSGDIDICAVGAAIGSGFHYTYYGEAGIVIPPAASDANGVALIEVADTANTYDFTIIWEE